MTSNRPRGWPRLLGPLMVATLAAGLVGCGQKLPPTPVPTSGTLTINGQKPDGALVILHPAQPDDREFPRTASGTTKAGQFTLTTRQSNDGVVPGEYIVCVMWPVTFGGPSADRLGGKFSDPKKSAIRVTIAQAGRLEPIEIKGTVSKPGDPKAAEDLGLGLPTGANRP